MWTLRHNATNQSEYVEIAHHLIKLLYRRECRREKQAGRFIISGVTKVCYRTRKANDVMTYLICVLAVLWLADGPVNFLYAFASPCTQNMNTCSRCIPLIYICPSKIYSQFSLPPRSFFHNFSVRRILRAAKKRRDILHSCLDTFH